MLENAARLANQPDTTLTEADVERIAQRVAQLLRPEPIELIEGVEVTANPALSEAQLQQIGELFSQKAGELIEKVAVKRTHKKEEG